MQTKKQINLDMFLDNMQFNTILIMVLLKTHQSFSFCAKKKHIFKFLAKISAAVTSLSYIAKVALRWTST